MPIYEFTCSECSALTTIFIRTVGSPYEARCSRCGSTHLTRLVPAVAYHRSEQTILEQYGIPGDEPRPDDYRDPRQIGRWVERKFAEYGLELPKEARQLIDAAREGEFPEPLRD